MLIMTYIVTIGKQNTLDQKYYGRFFEILEDYVLCRVQNHRLQNLTRLWSIQNMAGAHSKKKTEANLVDELDLNCFDTKKLEKYVQN